MEIVTSNRGKVCPVKIGYQSKRGNDIGLHKSKSLGMMVTVVFFTLAVVTSARLANILVAMDSPVLHCVARAVAMATLVMTVVFVFIIRVLDRAEVSVFLFPLDLFLILCTTGFRAVVMSGWLLLLLV